MLCSIILCFIAISSTKTCFSEIAGIIYIRADGSIDPPTAPIYTADNVTYTLASNITADADGIVIERDNIVLNGAGYTLQGIGNGKGIDLSGMSNVTIENVKIDAFYIGIYLRYSSGNTVSGSDVTANNLTGILLDDSSPYNSVSGNNITANGWSGIGLYGSSSNTISGNKITSNGAGIVGGASSNNSISGNNITANNVGEGIWLYASSDNNSISGNDIVRNKDDGIVLVGSNNRIFGNNVIANNYNGIAILSSDSMSNHIYHNNFIDNDIQADPPTSVNVWDDGYPSGGNYWSDYSGFRTDLFNGIYQNETGSDGISDTAITINPSIENVDHYPLMGMFSEFDWVSLAAPEQPIQTICNSTISNLVYNGTAISYNVTGEDETVGFCRIRVPTVLLSGTYKVFVNGTEVTYRLLQFSDETYRYLYFNYTHPTQEVTIIPEFPSFLILPIFFLATLLTVRVYKRKHP